MKRLITVFVAMSLLCAGFAALAQSDMIIKQRARDLANANNAQQAAPPAAPPSTPAPSSPAELELKHNLDKLESDLTDIKSGVDVTPEQKQVLQNDLLTLARSSVKPSKAAINKLVDDLATALSGSNTSLQQQGRLAKVVNIVVNSSMSTPTQAQSAVTVAQSLLHSSGVADADVQTVCDDLKAILADIQQKTPGLYQ